MLDETILHNQLFFRSNESSMLFFINCSKKFSRSSNILSSSPFGLANNARILLIFCIKHSLNYLWFKPSEFIMFAKFIRITPFSIPTGRAWRITQGGYAKCEAKWKKNLGEGQAEPRTIYPLLSAPNVIK